MKIVHRPDIDYLSIDFKDGVEARSYVENGIIVREDKNGAVIGIDIVDSSKIFFNDDTVTLQEACKILGVSESTLRRKIRNKEIKYTRPNGKDYRFKKKDLLKIAS